MARTNNDDEVPLISFVPEEHKPDKERISSFKVYSTPGDTSTTRYDFTIFHIDGNESLGILLNFKRQVQKLKVATAATAEASAPAFKNVVEALCHEPARTAFSQGVQKSTTRAWKVKQAAKKKSELAKMSKSDTDLTSDEAAALRTVLENVPVPAISQQDIEHKTY